MASDTRVPGRGGARGQNLEYFDKLLYSVICKFFMSAYLDNHRSESFDTLTKGTHEELKASDPRVHAPGVGQNVKI